VNLPEFVNIPPDGCASSAARRRILPALRSRPVSREAPAHRGVHRPLEADCRARSDEDLATVIWLRCCSWRDAVTRRPRTFKRPGSSSCAPPLAQRAGPAASRYGPPRRSSRGVSPSGPTEPESLQLIPTWPARSSNRTALRSAARTPQGARTGPRYAPAHYQLGLLAAQRGEAEEAIREWRQPSIWIPTMLQPTTLWPMRSTREVRPPRR